MPKTDIIQTDFSAGELSPKARGRVDIARYNHAAKVLRNVISRTLGGAQKRYGSEYIAQTKDMTKRARLIPYVLSKDKAYMLEMGENYLRVFKPDGTQVKVSGSPYEVATPYSAAQVVDIDYAMDETAMYLFHPEVFPNRIRSFADDKWGVGSAPFTTTPFSELGDYPAADVSLSSNIVGTGITATASAAVFMASDVGRAILWNAGVAVITAYTSTTVVTVEIKSVFDAATIPSGSWNLDSSPQTTCTPGAKEPVGASTSLTLSAAGWRSADVGKFVRINGGVIQITAVSTTTAATGTIVHVLSSTVGAPALAWTLDSSVWNSRDGYPRTGTMHEQRMVAAGTKAKPQTFWGSRSGEPLDFTLGTNDDEGFAFTVAGNDSQVNEITYLVSGRSLLALSSGGEYAIYGGVEKPITPTNVTIKSQTPHGAAGVRPEQVGKETLFVQRAGRKLRAMGYHYDEDGYKAPDITTLSDHVTETGIAGLAFQQEPDPVVWVWLENGKFVSCTLDRELDVVAWNSHETDGAVESMAVIPDGDSEQVWMIVRRSVNGAIVRYIERFRADWYPIYGTASPDPDAFPPGNEPFSWGFTLDCALTQDDATGKATWTGLAHLEGETIRVLADGSDMGEFDVTGGAITLPRTAKRILAGIMFSPTIELLTPEIQGGGTIQGGAMSSSGFVVRVVDTVGCRVNGAEVIPGRKFAPDQLDGAPDLFTGEKSISTTGWERGRSDATITQDGPFPFHLLAVIRTITVNGG